VYCERHTRTHPRGCTARAGYLHSSRLDGSQRSSTRGWQVRQGLGYKRLPSAEWDQVPSAAAPTLLELGNIPSRWDEREVAAQGKYTCNSWLIQQQGSCGVPLAPTHTAHPTVRTPMPTVRPPALSHTVSERRWNLPYLPSAHGHRVALLALCAGAAWRCICAR
jgi:hypothetical protein